MPVSQHSSCCILWQMWCIQLQHFIVTVVSAAARHPSVTYPRYDGAAAAKPVIGRLIDGVMHCCTQEGPVKQFTQLKSTVLLPCSTALLQRPHACGVHQPAQGAEQPEVP
jgi:hypothetical protein